jgi:hypothetical protein
LAYGAIAEGAVDEDQRRPFPSPLEDDRRAIG